MKIFSFDAETDGLYGKAFALAAVVIHDGREIARFSARTGVEPANQWVRDNVLPALVDMPVTHADYVAMLVAFSAFYAEHKGDAHIIAHMPSPVETRVIFDMHRLGLIGDFDGPYPLRDVAGYLDAAGFDPTSVDQYVAAAGLHVDGADGLTPHHPLYDALVAAAAYRRLRGDEL